MQIILQWKDSGLYLSAPDSPGVRDRGSALQFVSSTEALEYCRQHKLSGLQLVLHFEQEKYELVMPIREEIPAGANSARQPLPKPARERGAAGKRSRSKAETVAGRVTGIVKWWTSQKGLGFIGMERGEDVFVHYSDIEGEGFKTLQEGETVSFEVIESEKGRRAARVRRLEPEADKPPGP